MATEVDARLEKIANTKFYSSFLNGDTDEEVTERVNLAAVFSNNPRTDESLNELIKKS